MSEAQIQRAIVAYLRHVLPGAIVTHVPNEGVRGGRAGYLDGARAKAMGQTAGFPIDCHGAHQHGAENHARAVGGPWLPGGRCQVD